MVISYEQICGLIDHSVPVKIYQLMASQYMMPETDWLVSTHIEYAQIEWEYMLVFLVREIAQSCL